jgi:glycosyltransferase
MKISVITAVSNSAESITATVISVINQKYTNYEHIIIDNKSTDQTLSLVKKAYSEAKIDSKLKIISEKDEGISDAFNKGIRNASGDVILILNSDDALYNEGIFVDVAEIFKDKGVGFVHGDMVFIDPVYGTNTRRPLLCPVSNTMPLNHPGMFIRKSLYEQVGLYDNSYKFAMDYELVIRIEAQIGNIEKHGFYYKKTPVVMVNSGGASWKYEMESIREGKRGLQKNGLWGKRALYKYILRMVRVRSKGILTFVKLTQLVKVWRNFKWS